MDTGGSENESAGPPNTLKRACDQCRSRKIKCDRRLPCSNCQNSQITCRSTGAGQKPKEQRRRVLISSEYEKKIDLIGERLAGIERALNGLRSNGINNGANASTSTTVPNNADSYRPTPTSGGITPSASSIAIEQHDASPAYEGYSSLSAHSAYASEFLETAMSRGALREDSPNMAAALSTLKQIVRMQNQSSQVSSHEIRFPSQKGGPGTGTGAEIRDLKMPPMEAVVSLLRKVKENPNITSFFGSYCSFMTVEDLTEKCREVYFCTDDYSHATFITVNGALYNLFLEFSIIAKGNITKETYLSYLYLCRYNMEVALASLNLLLPATKENIEALILGAMYAIEISKPSFAWTLTSTAAQLCQALGYHRTSSMEHESRPNRERKLRLFWTIYCLNKALSLRLGRASVIQDYDISLTPGVEDLGIEGAWKEVFPLWIRLAKIQGKVYELLYSPAALAQSEGERVAQAQALADEMKWGVMIPIERIDLGSHNVSEIDSLYLNFDHVSRLSVLTLIYRAIPPQGGPPSTFTKDCVETARAALEAHQICMTTIKESTETLKCSYMHWTILYAPFAPFIVLFCHIIESSSFSFSSWPNHVLTDNNNNNNPNTPTPTSAEQEQEQEQEPQPQPQTPLTNINPDLTRLEEFVLSLDPLTTLSEAIFKLHRLCQVLVNIAKLYTEAKTKARLFELQAQSNNSSNSNNNNNNNGGVDSNSNLHELARGQIDLDLGDSSTGTGTGSGAGAGAGIRTGIDNDTGGRGLAQVGQEFDVYLSALGFVPGFQGSGQGVGSSFLGGGTSSGGGGGAGGSGSGSGSGLGGYGHPGVNLGPGPGYGIGIPNPNSNSNHSFETLSQQQQNHQQNHQQGMDDGLGAGVGVPFSALDGAGAGTGSSTVAASIPPGDTAMFQSMQLGNWFSGNRYMMGLLEEDFSGFDMSGWS